MDARAKKRSCGSPQRAVAGRTRTCPARSSCGPAGSKLPSLSWKRRDRYTAAWLSSVQCLGPVSIVSPFSILSGDSQPARCSNIASLLRWPPLTRLRHVRSSTHKGLETILSLISQGFVLTPTGQYPAYALKLRTLLTCTRWKTAEVDTITESIEFLSEPASPLALFDTTSILRTKRQREFRTIRQSGPDRWIVRWGSC